MAMMRASTRNKRNYKVKRIHKQKHELIPLQLLKDSANSYHRSVNMDCPFVVIAHWQCYREVVAARMKIATCTKAVTSCLNSSRMQAGNILQDEGLREVQL